MASVILGGIGTALGGPIGGMIGAELGSLIDDKLFNHKHINPPNPFDLIVESSAMGVVIPRVYGRCRMAGNLVMSTQLIPVLHNGGKKGGGKGGGGGKSSGKGGQPYYTYYVTCAVAICAGPINNIWRIYADSKVIWDMDPETTSGGQALPMSGFLANGSTGALANLYDFGTGKNADVESVTSSASFYYGTEDQQPDGYLESVFGAENVPAFRGLAYVVFEYLPLAAFGNRVPNFAFEVNGFYPGGGSTVAGSIIPGVGVFGASDSEVVYDATNNIEWVLSLTEVTSISGYNAETITSTDVSVVGGPWGDTDQHIIVSAAGAIDSNHCLWAVGGGNSDIIFIPGLDLPLYPAFRKFDPYAGLIATYPFFIDAGSVGTPYGAYDAQPWSATLAGLPGIVAPRFSPTSCCWLGTTGIIVAFDANDLYFFMFGYPGYATLTSGTAPMPIGIGRLTSSSRILYDTTQYSISAATPGASIVTPTEVYNDSPSGFSDITCVVWAGNTRDYLVLFDGVNLAYYLVSSGGSDGTTLTLAGPYSLSGLGFASGSVNYGVTYDGGNDVFLFFNDVALYSISDMTTPAIVSSTTPTTLDGSATFDDPLCFFPNQLPGPGYVAALTATGNVFFLDTVALGAITSTYQNPINILSPQTASSAGILYPNLQAATNFGISPVFAPQGAGGILYDEAGGHAQWALYSFGAYPIALATIVQDICERCGLASGQIDVSASTDYVWGYMISSEASGRAALEPLMQVFFFDMVERSGKLTFVYRASSAATPDAITISQNDLGARLLTAGGDAGAQPTPRVTEIRKQDIDLPFQITMRYRTTDADMYVRNFCMQIATQYAKRNTATTAAVGRITINSPVVLDDAHAATIAAKALELQWEQRTTFEFALPFNYLAIESGDVVPVTWATYDDSEEVSYNVYVTQAEIGADNTIHFQGMSVASESYSTPAQGSQSTINATTPFVGASSTTTAIMQLPPLRDQDDSMGIYWAMCGVGSSLGWVGLLYESMDGGSSYDFVGFENIAATIGYARTALGSAGPFQAANASEWDLTNTVTFQLVGGAPASVTPEDVLNGSNIFLVGREIIGAATVTDNGGGSYTLSLLRRGIQGTDNQIASHLAGEMVVLLAPDGSVNDLEEAMSELNRVEFFTGATLDQSLAGVVGTELTPTGLRIMPEAAAKWVVTYDASNNATIAWVPRRRIGYQLTDGAELFCDEPVEEYQIDIVNPAGGVVRTLSSWTTVTGTVGSLSGQDTGWRNASYSAADQSADGVTPGSITFSIYQISTRIGRGVARTFTS